MLNKYLKLLGLDKDASLTDIKKAYRLSAKKNHPDKFSNGDEKIKQAKIMADITEAYKYIIKNPDQISPDMQKNNSIKNIANDYKLYKLGMTYYKKYFDTFFKFFSKRELITPEEKRICLNNAGIYFNRLLNEFPESDWGTDARDKMKKINEALKTLY